MIEDSDDLPLVSGPFGLSARPDEPDDEPSASASASARYETGAVLGRGGMGEVRCMVDRRLGRTVARKVARRGDATAEARLAREARITARLEHPGIVPIYDVGRDPEGRLYYTMRIIRGRTLASAMAEIDEPSARMTLLRHFLDACTAVAYAHGAGVIHRDLSPANILVGAFGETQVADWGLAVELDDAPGIPSSAGTPAYMSPEQVLGRPVDRRSDVWTLGAVLHELVTGTPPFGRVDRADRRRHGQVPTLRTRDPELSIAPDLAAIVDRALHPEPDQRYPDAAALADDLARFIDGRAVAAYRYSPWESLLRLARAWRAPLAVAAVALALLAVVGVMAWERNVSARQRAERAERHASAARSRADDNLARTLVVRALELHRRGQRAHAEVLAAHALELRESPEARGVLAAGYGHARPRLQWRERLPCRSATFDERGELRLCLTDDGVEVDGVLRPVPDAAEIGRAIELGPDRLAIIDEHHRLVFHDADGESLVHSAAVEPTWPMEALSNDAVVTVGGARLVVVDRRLPMRIIHQPCADSVLDVARALDGRLFVACSEGALLEVAPDAPAVRQIASVPVAEGRPSSLRHDGARDELLVGTLRGVARVVDARHGTLRARVALDPRPIPDIRLHPEDPWRAAVQVWRGETLVVDLHDGRVEHRLPPADVEQTRWREGGRILRRLGASMEDWALENDDVPWPIERGSGVSTIAVDRVGDALAVGYGSGRLDLHGREPWATQLYPDVLKDVAFSPDGARLATAVVRDPAVRILDARTGAELHRLATRPCNRLLWLGDTVVGVAYSGGPRLFSMQQPDAAPTELPVRLRFADAEPLGDDRALLLDASDTLWWLDPLRRPALTAWVERPGTLAVAPLSDGGAFVTEPNAVIRLDPAGVERSRLEASGQLLEVATSPDERWVAAGTADGRVLVWAIATGDQAAVLSGHEDRVVTLAFPSSRVLLSGGWDGRVHRWDLQVLDRPASSLRLEAERRWGLDLEHAMAD